MTYFDIYLTALSFIGEPENTSSTADYQKRAERLCSHINASLYGLHTALGGDKINAEDFFAESLDAPFLLDERLIVCAALELSSLLILDKHPEISKMLCERTESEKARISAMATTVGKTREVYGL